mgnify:CR=1 FL=1
MKVFDGHTHYHETEHHPDSSRNHLEIFNSIQNYHDFNQKFAEDAFFAIIFDFERKDELISILGTDTRIKALKIHTRIQNLDEEKFQRLCQELDDLDTVVA